MKIAAATQESEPRARTALLQPGAGAAAGRAGPHAGHHRRGAGAGRAVRGARRSASRWCAAPTARASSSTRCWCRTCCRRSGWPRPGVATVEDIDTAVVAGLSHPMGPLRLSDLVGPRHAEADRRLDVRGVQGAAVRPAAAAAADGRGRAAGQEVGPGLLQRTDPRRDARLMVRKRRVVPTTSVRLAGRRHECSRPYSRHDLSAFVAQLACAHPARSSSRGCARNSRRDDVVGVVGGTREVLLAVVFGADHPLVASPMSMRRTNATPRSSRHRDLRRWAAAGLPSTRSRPKTGLLRRLGTRVDQIERRVAVDGHPARRDTVPRPLRHARAPCPSRSGVRRCGSTVGLERAVAARRS